MSSTVFALLRDTTRRLENTGNKPDAASCEWLLAECLGCSRAELPLMRTRLLTAPEILRFENGVKRLERGEPLAYVLGHACFFGRRIMVNSSVLVPRPETEELVALILECKELWCIARPQIADVGTGSGCIAITLALERPLARLRAVDCDLPALETARHNAKQWGVLDKIEFMQGDLLSGFAEAGLHAVVANLPYVPTRDLDSLERSVRDFEPRFALDGGSDGLALVRRITQQALKALAPGGRLFLEIGFDQGPALLAMLEEEGWSSAKVLPDLQGRDRFAVAVKT